MSNAMLIHCGLLLFFLTCVSSESGARSEFSKRFSFWPSVHNAATLVRYRRDAQTATDVAGPNEGGEAIKKPDTNVTISATPQQVGNKTETKIPSETMKVHQEATTQVSGKITEGTPLSPLTSNGTDSNSTAADKSVKPINFNNPGVLKRGLIVFGGFSLMAIAYLIFYRKKNNSNDTSNSHSMIDANQFRYGVLQSDDKRDHELSRIPLTMESEDDDDEDLEIFDLEQKKKSLSYVNLQTNDEEVVLSPNTERERDDLLLDIDDANSETLINWSTNGSKSIL